TLKKGEQILDSLKRKGILEEGAKMEDALGLTARNILERRLQTIVFKKGLANTIKQARQLIVHGHIAVDGRRVTAPSYIVERDEEDKIGFYGEVSFIKGKEGIKEGEIESGVKTEANVAE
ncbi:MAG: 30S ribosomal protein S4, partial [Candidatus Methanospirareceae archaeon]